MTKLVRQRFSSDCVLCSVAMALDIPYEDAVALLNKFDKDIDTDKMLNQYGLSNDIAFILLEFGGWKPVLLHGFYPHERCIANVASVNNVGGRHAVYWDGKNLFDPSIKIQHTVMTLHNAFESIVNLDDAPEKITLRVKMQREEYQKYII